MMPRAPSPRRRGGLSASVPDLPGSMSDEETPERAVSNVEDAISPWIEAAEDMGRPVPQPSLHLAIA